MNINSADLVLEVGSGDKPYPRSDVLLDKLPEDSSERDGGKSLVIDRPLVIGNAEALPFPNKSFDYIIASHVLEHARDPAKFLDELSRVGKRGYIETPLPLRERVFDWSFHRWYVFSNEKKLVLVKKTAKSKKLFAGLSPKMRKKLHHLEGKKLRNFQFEWQGEIDYKIFSKEPPGFLESLDKKLNRWQKSPPQPPAILEKVPGYQWLRINLFKLKFELEKILQARKRRKGIDLLSLIVCPNCKRELKMKRENLVCLFCDKAYGFYRGKIPCLL